MWCTEYPSLWFLWGVVSVGFAFYVGYQAARKGY
jgi:hypothetical protein